MAVTAKVQMFFKSKVAQSERSSTSKDNSTCIIEENPSEKVHPTLHLVTNYVNYVIIT